jgi:phosphohistidine phosphatase
VTMTSDAGRTLVLLRHAKSAWPDVPDHERPLAPRGRRDAAAIGRWLSAGHVPDQVVCSTARRARQAWQIAQRVLGSAPAVVFDDRVYEASTAQLLDLIRRVPAAAQILLIVGHDPALPELARTLAEASSKSGAGAENGAASAAMLDRMRVKFPTAAVAVFECAWDWARLGPERTRLVCFVAPRELRAPAVPDGDDR